MDAAMLAMVLWIAAHILFAIMDTIGYIRNEVPLKDYIKLYSMLRLILIFDLVMIYAYVITAPFVYLFCWDIYWLW